MLKTTTIYLEQTQAQIQALGTVDGVDLSSATVTAKDFYIAV